MARRCWSSAYEKTWSPCWARTRSDRQGLKGDSLTISNEQPVSLGPSASANGVLPSDEEGPDRSGSVCAADQTTRRGHLAFGYRPVAHLLNFNKNTVHRVFQMMRWQVKKRPVGFRPRVRA